MRGISLLDPHMNTNCLVRRLALVGPVTSYFLLLRHSFRQSIGSFCIPTSDIMDCYRMVTKSHCHQLWIEDITSSLICPKYLSLQNFSFTMNLSTMRKSTHDWFLHHLRSTQLSSNYRCFLFSFSQPLYCF